MSRAKYDHGHAHEHAHDHACGDDCAHKHEHMHDPAHAQSHDPAIFSETYELVLIKESSTLAVQEALVHWIEKVLEWAKNNHGFVGHIKVFIEGAENLWLSSTGKAINMKSSSGWTKAKLQKVTIDATAIIFGTTKAILDKYAEQYFEDCVEKECPHSTLTKKLLSKEDASY